MTHSDVTGGFSGTCNIDLDPMFVDPASGDLHLRIGSPAMDAGLDTGALTPTDRDGDPRVVGAGPDIRAYEITARARIVALIPAIDTLASRGALASGPAGALTARLREALQSLSSGRAQATSADLTAFADQVRALVRAGRLCPVQAQPWIQETLVLARNPGL